MVKKLAVINALSVVLVLFVNYYSQTGNINDQTVGGLSARYANLFTPAGYAFAIWGIIFLSLIAFSVNQLRLAFSKKSIEAYSQIGYLFAWVNLGNASWVVAWLYELTGLSVIIMVLMLIGLLKIVINTNMERWDAPFKIILYIWWPICIYAGWIAVATIANVSAYLAKLEWTGGMFSEVTWTLILIVVAVVVNVFMIWSRGMREFALVGIWALMAIYVRHQDTIVLISYFALVGSALLCLNISAHGFINRKTNPLYRLLVKS